MATQDNTITIPLEVDPTPAVEALKSFLNVVADVGAQSQKLLAGQMLAPNFASIDAEVTKLNATLAQHVSEVRAAAGADAGIGATASRTTVAATEAENASQRTFIDLYRQGRSERRMGMFLAMEASRIIQTFTGDNNALARAIAEGAQTAFGMKFALDAMGFTMASMPLAGTAAGIMMIVAALKAEADLSDKLTDAIERQTKAMIDNGTITKKQALDMMQLQLQAAEKLRDEAANKMQIGPGMLGTIHDVVMNTEGKSIVDQQMAAMTEYVDANTRVQVILKSLAEMKKQIANDEQTDADKYIEKSRLEYELGRISADEMERRLRLEEATTDDVIKRFQIEKQIKTIEDERDKRRKEMAKAAPSATPGTGYMSAAYGAQEDAEKELKAEEGIQYQISKYRAEGIQDATQRENFLYETEMQHIMATEEDKRLLEAQLYALKVEHENKLADLDRQTFEKSWGYAEQLGQILGEAFGKADNSTQKFIQYLQIALQIAKEIRR